MDERHNPSLIEILRKTLEQLQSLHGLNRDDPTYQDLRTIIVRASLNWK